MGNANSKLTTISDSVSDSGSVYRPVTINASARRIPADRVAASDSIIDKGYVENNDTTDAETTTRTVCRVQFGNISVNLKVGNLIEQRCDVIVGTCTQQLQLSKGSLSNVILKVAGPALQTECSRKYPHGIQYGQVAVVAAGKMPCSCVYFGTLPHYDIPPEKLGETPTEVLKTFVTGCLEQAFKDIKPDLCFPAIGTGYLRYPQEITAQTMLEAISDFNTDNRGVTMTLNIVLGADGPNQKMIQEIFMNVFQKHQTTSSDDVELKSGRTTQQFCEFMYRNSNHYPPGNWTCYSSMRPIKDWQIDAKGKVCYKLVTIKADQDEYRTVEKLVQSTWEREKVGLGRDAEGLEHFNFQRVNITKVQRVENLPLLEKYANRRAELFRKAGGNMFPHLKDCKDIKTGRIKTEDMLDSSWRGRLYAEVNETYLFHGTKSDTVESVLKQGIDVRMAQGGAVYGPAVYLAESSTKSDQYTDERGDRKMNGLQMFLCRACLGKIKVMSKKHKFRQPPCKEGCMEDGCCHDRYDSIVHEGTYIFREFVVYDTHQAYPEYIITYDRKKTV